MTTSHLDTTYSPSASACSYTAYKEENNVISFNKIMEGLKIPKEYYKADYGVTVSDWLKKYKIQLEEPPFKFDYTGLKPLKPYSDSKNKNHLPDELFEI